MRVLVLGTGEQLYAVTPRSLKITGCDWLKMILEYEKDFRK